MTMEMFARAAKVKLRFDIPGGYISTEDLWDLSLEDLNSLCKSLNKKIKEFEEEDFLEGPKSGERTIKLKFKIVLNVLEAKKAHKEKCEKVVERKAKKQRILEIIEKKQGESLEGKSEDELKSILDDLDDPEDDVEDID